MKIVDIPIEKLNFYEKNPRKNDESVSFIANSISRFGFKVPISVDKNNVIICGHTRVKAAIKLGLKTVPCVIESEMTDKEIKAFRLIENKSHELSFWDKSLLESEMDDLIGEFEFEDYGFLDIGEALTDKDIDMFFEENAVSKPDQVSDEHIEEKPTTIICPHCGGVVDI